MEPRRTAGRHLCRAGLPVHAPSFYRHSHRGLRAYGLGLGHRRRRRSIASFWVHHSAMIEVESSHQVGTVRAPGTWRCDAAAPQGLETLSGTKLGRSHQCRQLRAQ